MAEENMNEFILEMDRKMSAKSFRYFMNDVANLGYDVHFNHHHESWMKGLDENRYYCVKASRDHGKSVFFMSYGLWLAAFNPNTHVMIFSHSLEQTLEHMRFIRNIIENTPCLHHLKPEGRPWAKSYFDFTNGSRMMAKSVGGATRGFHPDVVVCDDILWGTTGSYNDLYAELEEKEMYTVETYPSINDEGEPLWPERWSLEALDQRRMSMPAIQFSREYLCEPIHDLASMFPIALMEQARDKDLILLDKAEYEYDEEGEMIGIHGQHFIGWDPAIASDKNADFTAMITMRVPPDDNVKQLVHVIHERGLNSLAQKRHMILLNSKFQPDLIELEGNNFQRMETELTRFGMQKNGRLESVGVHDDLAMALALANWGTKEFRGSIVMLDDYMPGFGDWLTQDKKKDSWMVP